MYGDAERLAAEATHAQLDAAARSTALAKEKADLERRAARITAAQALQREELDKKITELLDLKEAEESRQLMMHREAEALAEVMWREREDMRKSKAREHARAQEARAHASRVDEVYEQRARVHAANEVPHHFN